MTTDFLAMDDNQLVDLISDFVRGTPSEIIKGVLNTIQDWNGTPTDYQKTKLLASIHLPQTKSKLIKLLDCWAIQYPALTSESIYLSIQTSIRTLNSIEASSLELIWTGPEGATTRFRRTDQALMQLINNANEQLLVVSFAVYKAQSIIDAIEKAIQRNVKVVICLEDSSESNSKLPVLGIKRFSSSIFRLASFYVWPIENRAHTIDGKFGSLHAKLAVADRNNVFISSANLTDYAMDLNMELGILIEDKVIGVQITDLFNNMIVNSVLQKVSIKKF